MESKTEDAYSRVYNELKNYIQFNPNFISVDFEKANINVHFFLIMLVFWWYHKNTFCEFDIRFDYVSWKLISTFRTDFGHIKLKHFQVVGLAMLYYVLVVCWRGHKAACYSFIWVLVLFRAN